MRKLVLPRLVELRRPAGRRVAGHGVRRHLGHPAPGRWRGSAFAARPPRSTSPEIGTSLVSGAAHHALGNVDWRTVGIAAPGFVGAFAGATLSRTLMPTARVRVILPAPSPGFCPSGCGSRASSPPGSSPRSAWWPESSTRSVAAAGPVGTSSMYSPPGRLEPPGRRHDWPSSSSGRLAGVPPSPSGLGVVRRRVARRRRPRAPVARSWSAPPARVLGVAPVA